jgi:hypothetical protein
MGVRVGVSVGVRVGDGVAVKVGVAEGAISVAGTTPEQAVAKSKTNTIPPAIHGNLSMN